MKRMCVWLVSVFFVVHTGLVLLYVHRGELAFIQCPRQLSKTEADTFSACWVNLVFT